MGERREYANEVMGNVEYVKVLRSYGAGDKVVHVENQWNINYQTNSAF